MRDEGDARGDELRPCGLDLDRAVAVPQIEPDAMIRAGHLAILELGLRNRRPEVHVPERRRLELIGAVIGQEAQKRRCETHRASLLIVA